STVFPYTTLFRSNAGQYGYLHAHHFPHRRSRGRRHPLLGGRPAPRCRARPALREHEAASSQPARERATSDLSRSNQRSRNLTLMSGTSLMSVVELFSRSGMIVLIRRFHPGEALEICPPQGRTPPPAAPDRHVYPAVTVST